MRKIILVFMLIVLTSCGMVESVGVTDTDPRIEFVTVYKGYFYLEMDDFSCDYNGIEPEKLIDSSEKLNELEKKFGDIITMDVDFNEYLLYANYESDYKSKVKTFDIAELAYNENTFVVLIDYQNGEVLDQLENKKTCFLNISKIRKKDFPSGRRDWLRIPIKK